MEQLGSEQHRRQPARVSFRAKANQSNRCVKQKPRYPQKRSVIWRRGRESNPRQSALMKSWEIIIDELSAAKQAGRRHKHPLLSVVCESVHPSECEIMKTIQVILAVLASLCLTSRAFSGLIKQHDLNQIRRGSTTEIDLVHMFGPPDTRTAKQAVCRSVGNLEQGPPGRRETAPDRTGTGEDRRRVGQVNRRPAPGHRCHELCSLSRAL